MKVANTDFYIEEIIKQLNVTANIEVSRFYEQGSSLKVEKKGNTAVITYGRRVELFRGLGLLAEHANEENYSTTQPARFKMDGMMLDCSRNGVMKLDVVKKFIRYMALMGLDTLMLYTEDTYEIPEYPYFGYMRGRYSCDELKEMDEYAYSYGIELIPCIQTLAHLEGALRWPCFNEVKDYGNILLCGEEKTYTLIEAMIRTCRNCFRTKRIHIGMDEAHMMGLGKYLDRNGYEKREEIFCRHLDRVNAICEKYDFKPMIWSDMFFRLGFQGEYYPPEGSQIDPSVIELVPPNVELVYWDYYHETKSAYDSLLDMHLNFRNPIIFAGGAWRWLGHGPALNKSLYQSRIALQSCLDKGIQEVFVTAWGDNGNEASFMCILPVMQQYAEFCYQGDVSNEVLAQRMKACTGENFDDMLLLDMANSVDENHWVCHASNPTKYLLYMDILGGLAELHTTAQYPEKFRCAAKAIAEAGERSPSYGYMFDTLAKLCGVLEIKSRVGVNAQLAYKNGDKNVLKTIADDVLPELLTRMTAFHESTYTQWMAECKANGYDVLDLRFGGLESRIKTAIRRINLYLAGKIDHLEELDEKRLTIDCRPIDDMGETEAYCNNFWVPAFSASIVGMYI